MTEDDVNLGQLLDLATPCLAEAAARDRFSSRRTRAGYALFLSRGYTVIL
jgi:hypothetical protein